MIPLRRVNILQTSLTRPDCQLWIQFDQLSVAVQPVLDMCSELKFEYDARVVCLQSIHVTHFFHFNIQKGCRPKLCPHLHLYGCYALEHKHHHMQFFLCPLFRHPSFSSPDITACFTSPTNLLNQSSDSPVGTASG